MADYTELRDQIATFAPADIPRWRTMDDETRSIEYSPSSALDGDIGEFIQAYVDKSALAYSQCQPIHTLDYGPKPSNTIDFVRPDVDGAVPLHVFIHGGYWQELSKRESFFPALDTLKRGIAFAAIDYTLAPHAGLDEIVAECCAAMAQLAEGADSLGVDRNRIVVSGSSAGAHLAAMCCLDLSPHLRPAGAVLMSGIFEVAPLIGTYINDALGLDTDTAERNSPALSDLSGFPRTVIAWGENETDEFKRQSRFFAALLRAAGGQVEALEMPARNHFDLVDDIANGSALGQRLAGLAFS